MIIHRTAPRTVPVGRDYDAHRDAVIVEPWLIAIELQGRRDGKWHAIGERLGVGLFRQMHFGRDCIYYDGPNHSLSFGPLQVYWWGGWCPTGQCETRTW